MWFKSIFDKYLRNIRGDVLIYQMGKVGSTALELALKKTSLKVSHEHTFGRANNFNYYPKKRQVLLNLKKVIVKRIIAREIRKRKSKLKIITLFRDPISRNISSFFQELHVSIYNKMNEDNKRVFSSAELINECYFDYVNHHSTQEWFERELKYFFDIDVYEYPFDKAQGIGIINSPLVDVLVINSALLDNNADSVKNFLELDQLSIERVNSGNQKWYSSMYREFVSNNPLDDEYIREQFDNKFANHFYSESQRRDLILKWTNKEKE